MANLKSKLKSPRVSDSEIQLVINRIYDEINQLIDAVNSVSNESFGEGEGKPGDIRVGEKSNRSISIEVRTEEGWFESQIFDTNPAIVSLTDSSGGASTNDTIEEVTDVATAKNGIKELAVKVNEIITVLNKMNPNGFKMIEKRG